MRQVKETSSLSNGVEDVDSEGLRCHQSMIRLSQPAQGDEAHLNRPRKFLGLIASCTN